MCNASGIENKLITTTTLANKRETWTSFKCDSVLFNVWLNKNLQATGKKSFNNSIIGIQTRTNCQCCIAYQVQKCEGKHDEIVWNTTKSHCNWSLLTQQWGKPSHCDEMFPASSERNLKQPYFTLISAPKKEKFLLSSLLPFPHLSSAFLTYFSVNSHFQILSENIVCTMCVLTEYVHLHCVELVCN